MAFAIVSRIPRAIRPTCATASVIAITAVLATAALLSTSAAWADDFSVGGDSRILGMGGAGIALAPDLNGGVGRVNPASLAFEKKGVSLTGPGLGFRSNHADIDKTSSYFITGTTASTASALARDFPVHDSDFGTNGDVGLRFDHFEISAGGVAIGRIQPNAALTNWVHSGSNMDNVPAEVRSDVYGASLYNLPAVSYALRIPQAQVAPYDLAMGVKLKYMEAVYSHYVANVDTIRGLLDATPAPEMNGNGTLTRQGAGMDFGLMLRPRSPGSVSAALVATNVVGSNLSVLGTDRNGRSTRYNLLASTLSAGLGYQRHGTTLAADVADIGASSNSTQLRMGIEQRVLKIVALRGGYCSGTGFTAGFGIRGISFAYGKRMPLEIAQTLRF